MDPLQSWLDAKAVRQMAESLMAPVPEVDETAVNAGYGDTFEGFAGKAADASVRPGDQVPEPSVHESKQFFNRSAASAQAQSPEPVPGGAEVTGPAPDLADESRRAVVESSLADAKRVAEDSGMLGNEPAAAQADNHKLPEDITEVDPEAETSAVDMTETAAPHPMPGAYESPFKISADQVHGDDDPVATRSHAEEAVYHSDSHPPQPQPQHQPNESAGEGSEEQQEAELPPIEENAKSFFRPAINLAEQTPAPDCATEPDQSVENDVSDQAAATPVADVASATDPSRAAMHDADRVDAQATDQPGGRGPFLSRLQQFSGIIRRDLGAKAMFLIDNEGQILLDEVGNAKLIQVARTLANASYRASRQTAGAAAVGNLHVKISANATLEVVPVESRYGLLILGVIFPAPIGAARVIQLADELFRTVEPHY